MRSRYRVSVGGVQMDTLDDNLLILDVSYAPADPQVNTNRVANMSGYDYGDPYLEKQVVTITFELHIYDILKRNEACQKVNLWASNGGTLTVNDRKDQRLVYVRCEQFASITSMRNWTDPLTIVFATTEFPYWQSMTEKSITIKSSGSGTLKLDGNYGKALVFVEATADANVTSYRIDVGDTFIEFKKTLSLASGDKLTINNTHWRYLTVKQAGKSVLSKMDPASSDSLLAVCGENTKVTVKANGKITTVVKARGLWL